MKVDPNIRPFLVVLERQLRLRELPCAIDLLWRKKPECTCRVQISDGEVVVPVSQAIRDARARVDDLVIRERIMEPRYLSNYTNHVEKLMAEGEVGLITIACAVFGPLTSERRSSQQYNPYVEFWLQVPAIGEALGPKWTEGLPDGQRDLAQIREAADTARRVGLLSGVEVRARTSHAVEHEPDAIEDEEDEAETEAVDAGTVDLNSARNEIYFGPPGTGKSYQIEQRLQDLHIPDERQFRVTFHPETSYYDLVGAYRPRVVWVRDGCVLPQRPSLGEAGEPRTFYEFVPGPLSLALKLVADTNEWTAVVIEEINRANCAAVFGDVFQLLDRRVVAEQQFEIGWSSYNITPSAEWKEWLHDAIPASSGIYDHGSGKLRLPPKLLLLASMNTSDQNLFPMDTAFRRRWSMRYVGIRSASIFKIPLRLDALRVDWSTFLSVINARIVSYTRTADKQMGPWFAIPRKNRDILEAEEFQSKVLFYLWNDVFADRPQEIFCADIQTYDGLLATYANDKHVFNAAILDEIGRANEKLAGGPASSR